MLNYEQVQNKDSLIFNLFGNWVISDYKSIQLPKIIPDNLSLIINFKKVKRLDTSGALVVLQWMKSMEREGHSINLEDLSKTQHIIFLQTKDKLSRSYPEISNKKYPVFYVIGRYFIEFFLRFFKFLSFLGTLFTNVADFFLYFTRVPWKNILAVIQVAGLNALPLITVLAFLVGIVLAHQLGGTLKSFGANIYIANLLVMSVFREFAPLITAIIVAGRTGCFFAAQIGTMNVNDELDALSVMGVSLYKRVVMPKLIGILIVLPLLTLWFSLFAILGGMIMASLSLDVGYTAFLAQVRTSSILSSFLLGELKTPFFAFCIAVIGCYQGLMAKKSAASVGLKTTKSVVNSIFLIIVLDAFFSVVYRLYGI